MDNLLQAAQFVIGWHDNDLIDNVAREFVIDELRKTIDYGVHVFTIPSIEDAPVFWDEEKAVEYAANELYPIDDGFSYHPNSKYKVGERILTDGARLKNAKRFVVKKQVL